MVVFPNAKINLGLNIISRRPDGYHNIESCFYPVQWTDVLEIVEAEETIITLSGIPVPGNAQENLCLKAYNLLKRDFGLPNVHLHLHKIIPIGAGLGGGSADASFTLKLLNMVFGLFLSSSLLEQYASILGSDCPFFIDNKPVIAKETGFAFEPISLILKGNYIVIVYPPVHIPTVKAYAGVEPSKPEVGVKEIIENYPIQEWKYVLKNDFEKSIFLQHPEIEIIKREMYSYGALYASMSGSGSCVYGIFDKKVELKKEDFDGRYKIWQGEL